MRFNRSGLRHDSVLDTRRTALCMAFLTLILFHGQWPANADEAIEFNRDIRPILAANCFECHGFDAKTRKADLRLDTAAGAYAVQDGVVAVKPGNSSDSELYRRVIAVDADLVMPPPETGKALKPAEVELLRRWIEQGAGYQRHWAFEVPASRQLPTVKQSALVRNPIDAFVLSKLESKRLQPQAEADRATLIRRVAFVLTGLPPKVSEVEEFLSDTSVDAYEQMVERFLASPRYGEEQARHWLDVARYADTHGLHLDNEREMWAYRDWVIDAFNSNLSFDQFTTWQIAGDLLPNPTQQQRVATGFNRCNVTTSEGGAITDEWVYRYAVDRTSTTMQTWMGLTAGCAVCHDHKYDPISSRDFYSMYAFFYSAADPGMDGNIRNTNPFTKVPTEAQRAELAAAVKRRDSAEENLKGAIETAGIQDPAELSNTEDQAISDSLIDDTFPWGSRTRNTSRNDAVWVRNPDFGPRSGERVLELAYGSRYDLTIELASNQVIVPEQGRLSFWMRVDADHVPGYVALQIDDGRNHRVMWGNQRASGNSGDTTMGPIPSGGEWTRIEIPLDTIQAQAGATIRNLVFTQEGGRIWIDDVRLEGRVSRAKDPKSSFRAWWASGKGSNPSGVSGEVSAILKAGPTEGAAEKPLQELKRVWLTYVQRTTESPVSEFRKAYEQADIDVAVVEGVIPGTFTFADMEKPRDAFVMLRGQYDKPGDQVEPGVPLEFPALRAETGEFMTGRRANRLDLARWFLSEENPLTARVTVNRIWQQVFGTGIVKTSDDFGTRGDVPSHPELLDWLAITFRKSGWDQKQLFRTLLSSSTFRQASYVSAELLQADPENRLLARGPRLRLDAEQLRDNVLYVSGLMDLTTGGRGVMPYQPGDIWEPVGYENSNTRFYLQDHGASLYRRSVYCFIKRTAPPPFMTNFDGPNREQFCVRRERSNTPLQALQLMNDVQHFEAARVLAERVMNEGGKSPAEQIGFLYRTVLSRLPAEQELTIVREALEQQQRHYAAVPEQAVKVIRNGESAVNAELPPIDLAAWTMVCSLVLNLDETICRN
jgi:hypothetical protein